MAILTVTDRGPLIGYFRLASLACGLLAASSLYTVAQTPQANQAPSTQVPDAVALVRRASQNELNPTDPPSPVRYKLRKQDDKGVTTKEIVETKDGDVARLVAKDDKPLTPEDEKAELDRLNNLLAHPEIQEHRHKREKEDNDRANELIRMLPDAFLYTYIGLTTGPNGPAHRLSFKPNPNFKAPDREGEVYHGMEGELWIDQGQERIIKLDAHLIADVNFGWGILGKLYKGGSLTIEQKDVGHRHWEATLLRLNLTGMALMIKPLSFRTTETSTDFQPVPLNMPYQDAVHMLLKNDTNGPQVASGSAARN
jgi:hypothetical protein